MVNPTQFDCRHIPARELGTVAHQRQQVALRQRTFLRQLQRYKLNMGRQVHRFHACRTGVEPARATQHVA